MGLIYICQDYLSGSAKESLSTVLEREKLELALPITGMAGDILPLQKSLHSSLQIKRITDQAGLLDYADVNCEAYGFPLEWGRSGLSGSTLWTEKAYSFLGYENDRAVSAASAIVNDGCLYLALVATRPNQTGCPKETICGGGCSSCPAAAHEATGLKRTILHATDAGYPVYQRVAYHRTANLRAYKVAAAT